MTVLPFAQPVTKPKPDHEYVVGGARRWYQQAKTQLLDLAFDDLTRDLGADIYDRMLLHPQVSAKINILRTWILQSGPTLRPFVTDKSKDGYQQASDLVSWCERVLDDLDTSLDDVILDLCLAIALGSRVAEIVAAYDATYTGRTQLVVRRLTVKPVAATRFVVDPALNIQGLYGGRVLDDDGRDAGPRTLPRDKFAIWSFRPRDNDPRGTSLLRPAYNAWNLSLQVLPEYYKYLVQFASPALDGEVGPDEQPAQERDEAGTPYGPVLSPEQRMLNRLLAFQNGTAIARPAGSKLAILWSQGDGAAFLNALRYFNNEIAVAITNQLLATEEGQFGSRAQSGTHQDAISVAIQQMKRSLCRMLRRDVLYETVRANYGDQVAALTPLIGLGETEQRDWATEIRAAGAVGYRVAPSQLTSLDSRFGLNARDLGEAVEADTSAAPGTDEDTAGGGAAPVPAEPDEDAEDTDETEGDADDAV